MKNKFFAGFGAALVLVLLTGAAASLTKRYGAFSGTFTGTASGTFTGSASGLTNLVQQVRASSTNAVLTAADTVILLSGDKSATLPGATTNRGRLFTVVCVSSGTNSIVGVSSETISGANSWTNTAAKLATTVVSDGTNWWTVWHN